MAKEKPHWHWPVAWRAEGKAFAFAKNKVVDLFAAGARRKGRLGLKRLAPTVGDRKIPNATPASLRSGMSRSSIQAATIVKVAKRAAQAAGDEPLGGFGPPF
jgi:hypothetical protein